MKHLPAALLLTLTAPALAAPAAPDTDRAGIPQAAFDDTRYLLGFDVYVAGGNLPAAWQVARKAVASRPADAAWLKRYAQVSEWVGEAAEALGTWLKLARLTGSDESWSAVGRLAPMLLDDEALLAYQQRVARQHPGDLPALLKLVDTYERLGRPEDGLRFLKSLETARTRAAVLEAEALLAERSGQDEAALAALNRLLALTPDHEARLLRRAALLYRRGDLARAQAGLAAAEKRMPPAATGYWQTYAELSRLLNRTEQADRAYRVLVAQESYTEGDLWNYAALLQDQDALAAAVLQERLFRRFGRANGAINALSLWQSAQAWTAAEQFLASLTPEEEAALTKESGFLEQRAHVHWRRGRLAEARRDYAAGLALAPDSVRLTQGLAGVLLAQNDPAALQRLLSARETLARRSEALWPVWAAGWQRLNRPGQALPYQRAWLRRHPEDALAALALADTLEATGQAAQAEQWRAGVLARAGAHLDTETPERRRQLEDSLLALSLPRTPPGEARQRLIARLGIGRPDAVSRDLMLGWLLGREAADAAETLAARTAQLLPLPGWTALGFALAAEDRPAMDHQLNTRLDDLPIYDRLEAADRLGRDALAVDVAFRTLEERAPDDDELHNRFNRLAGRHGHRLDLSLSDARQDTLDYATRRVDGDMPLGDRRRLALRLEQESPTLADPAALARAPADRRLAQLTLEQRSARSVWQAGLHQTGGLDTAAGLSLAQDYRVDSRLRLQWAWDTQRPTADSVGLRVAGLVDRLGGGLHWTPDGRHQISLTLDALRYQAQGGGALGEGHTLRLEAGHRLFAAQPDHVLKLQFSLGSFTADTATPLSPALAALVPAGIAADSRFFLPQDYRQLAVAWAFGQIPDELPVRGWRLFGETGLNHSDNGGNGYRLQLGLHGPVLGRDRLRLQLEAGRSGQTQGDNRALSLDYRLYY